MGIAIIPAKGTSRRIPHKNRKLFHGRPIISYSIETAKESGLFDRIIVSTDDDEIADIAKEYGAEIHYRSEVFSRDEVGTQTVAKLVLDDIDADYEDMACVIYATAPMLNYDTLRQAYYDYYLMEPNYYVAPMSEWPIDPGQFYLGEVTAFREGKPLHESVSIIPIDPRTAIDINTPEDWAKAEQMYEELHNGN